jgi:glycosyltransferase involved in cell wall biosynthesis
MIQVHHYKGEGENLPYVLVLCYFPDHWRFMAPKVCDVSVITYVTAFDRLRSRLLRSPPSAFVLPPFRRRYPAHKRVLRQLMAPVVSNTIDAIRLRPLMERCGIKRRPDVIFAYDFFKRIMDLENLGCPSVYYVTDCPADLSRYFELANLASYDYVLVAHKDYLPLFKDVNPATHWFPLWATPAIYEGIETSRTIDISFVGTYYKNHPRGYLLSKLRERFAVCIKSGISLREYAEILLKSKITFNKSLNGDVNTRVFEATSAGSLLITDRTGNGLLELFEEDSEIVCYDDEEELIAKVSYYLDADDERERIASRGRRRALSEHTIVNRMRTLLSLIA